MASTSEYSGAPDRPVRAPHTHTKTERPSADLLEEQKPQSANVCAQRCLDACCQRDVHIQASRVSNGATDDNSVVYISTNDLERLTLYRGDTVLLRGRAKRDTVLIVLTGDDQDDGHVGINGVARKNLGVHQGDSVWLRPCPDIQYTKRLVLLPIADTVVGLTGNLFDVYLAPYYRETYRPVRKGNFFTVRGGNRVVEFKIMECEPADFGIVAQDTVIHCEGDPLSRESAEKEPLSYDQVGGYIKELAQLREIAELPFKHPQLFTSLGVKLPRGVLLHGPSGVGKSLMVRAMAAESGVYFFQVNGTHLNSTVPAQNLRLTFEEAEKRSPAIILIEQVDLVAPKRQSIISDTQSDYLCELLAIFDKLEADGEPNILIVGCTTQVNDIDPALLRPGRFGQNISVNLPDTPSRLDILHINLRKAKLSNDVDVSELAAQTEGFSGADLVALCREAAMQRIRAAVSTVAVDVYQEAVDQAAIGPQTLTMVDFVNALGTLRPVEATTLVHR